MASKPVSILEELYFHRVFMRTNRQPKSIELEPLVSETELEYFISDVFEYALFIRGIEGWDSPFKIEKTKRDDTVKRHFNFDIGDAIVHSCAIEESCRIAKENAFDANKLMYLPSNEAMVYVRKFIGLVVVNTRPVNISFIHALTFACTLCGIVAKNPNWNLFCIALCVTAVFRFYFPYEWIYYDFKQWAFAYMFRHKQIHGG